MADTNLSDLDPALAALYQPFVDGCAAQGITVKIIQGWRSPSYQDHLQSSGISKLGASQSLHCCTVAGKPASKAFDFGVFETDGSYVTNGNDTRYTIAGEVAENLGLIWGGSWHNPDFDHIQLSS
jgi:hypothetical protein